MSAPQPTPKCGQCQRPISHAHGCSKVVCEYRRPQQWDGLREGNQGTPGRLAEDSFNHARRAL